MKKLFLVLVFVIAMVGCTENQRAKNFGGKSTVQLEQGQKLVNATWKEDNLWLLTREMRPGETAETYKFQEKSSYGVMEGTYIIVEKE